MSEPLNRRSRAMTEGVSRTANRAMLRAVGFTDEDFTKPIVGVASADSDVSPCNITLEASQLKLQATFASSARCR